MNSCGHFGYTETTPRIREIGLGVAALEYAALGYAVLPLDRGGKRPHRMLGREGGVHHATTDPAVIAAWWLGDLAANVGVATGQASRLIVVDLDVKNGSDGPREFSRLLSGQAPGHWAGCPYQRTPSGGTHIWLRWPWEYPCPERPGILPGVDVKGDGGLIVAAPSMQILHPRAEPGSNSAPVAVPYSWAQGCPCTLPECPPWLAQWAHDAPSARRGDGSGDGDDIDVQKVLAEGAPPGQRNATYYRLACKLYRQLGTTIAASAEVASKVQAAWKAGGTEGMPYSEILTICDSARRFVESQVQNEMKLRASAASWLRGA